MDAGEPRLRRRGFFLHSPDAEPDAIEQENPEGVVIRIRVRHSGVPRRVAVSGGRSRTESRIDDARPQIRSGSVTGSRQRAHLPR